MRRLSHGVVALSVAATLSGLLVAPAVQAAPVPPGTTTSVVPQENPDPSAAEVPASNLIEKGKAVHEIEVGEPTTEWTEATDAKFVFLVYDRINATDFPLTKEEAYRVYRIMVSTPAAPDATAFIRTGIFDFAARDRTERMRRQDARNAMLRMRKEVAIDTQIPFDDVMLNDNDQIFVYKVYQRAQPNTRVKAGALEAFGGNEEVWKTFIETKLRELHVQDKLDYFEREKQKGEEAEKRAIAREAKRDACHKVPLVEKEEWLDLTDDNFIRALLATSEVNEPAHREIKATATTALLGTATDWAWFITTGVGEARQRDDARALRELEEADRQKVRDIKARAEASRLRPRLAAAAGVAAGQSWEQVKEFLARGQYLPLTQALGGMTTDTRGWHVRSAGGDAWATPGEQPATVVTAPLGDATWKVVTGLSDVNCYSLESATRVGSYLRVGPNLRVRLEGNDGTADFKNDATWCPKPGNNRSAGVSLESWSQRGRFLRQFFGQLWASHGQSQANNNFDTYINFGDDSSWKVVDPNPNITTKIELRTLNQEWWSPGTIGHPNGAEVIDTGIRVKPFQNGAAYYNPSKGVIGVLTPVLQKYLAIGGHKVPNNLPDEDTLFMPDGQGRANFLQGGKAIYYHPRTGANLIYGAILQRWAALLYERGKLGYPVTDEMDGPDGKRVSYFEHGWIEHTAATGARDYYY